MKESINKKEGAWMTPAEIVDKMINFGDLDYTKNILEPTAGNGNIVMKVIDKKISIGMTPQQAIDSTYGNELNKERYDDMIKRLKEFCINNNCNFPESNFTNEDILKKEIDIENYEIITNLPFGSWSNSNLPRQIINKFTDTKAIYLTKWSTGCNKKYVQHVKKFENIVFPGIVYDTLLWEYDPEYTEGDIWIYWPLPKLPKHKLRKDWKEILKAHNIEGYENKNDIK